MIVSRPGFTSGLHHSRLHVGRKLPSLAVIRCPMAPANGLAVIDACALTPRLDIIGRPHKNLPALLHLALSLYGPLPGRD